MSPNDLLVLFHQLADQYGYVVVFLGAALDNTGIPAAGDVTLLAAGFLASEGELNFALCLLLAGLGAAFGDNAAYWVGRLGGRPMLERVARLLRLKESKLKSAEGYFNSHGGKTVFFGRFLPTLRSLSPLLAGVGRMNYGRFALFNLAAVSLWALLAGTLGYLFGQYWEDLFRTWRVTGLVALGIAVLVVLALLVRARRKKGPRVEGPESEQQAS